MATANQGWARDYSACVCTYPERTHMCVPRLVKLKHTCTRVQEQTRGDLGRGVQAPHKHRHRSVLGKAQARVCAHAAHAVAGPGNPVLLRRTRGAQSTHTAHIRAPLQETQEGRLLTSYPPLPPSPRLRTSASSGHQSCLRVQPWGQTPPNPRLPSPIPLGGVDSLRPLHPCLPQHHHRPLWGLPCPLGA